LTPETALQHVPLHEQHIALGARMVPFAGYEMPVQYRAGVLREHLHTRAAASIFDVSHMGQILIRPRSGNLGAAALDLERLTPADIVSLQPGRQRYALFTVPGGGIFDDLMAANFGTHYFLVVNASRKQEDAALLQTELHETCEIEMLTDRALLAVQGPQSEAILSQIAPSVTGMRFMDAGLHSLMGIDCMVSRSGYTGEDGFEISVPARHAASLWETLLRNPNLQPAGLGARDSLRLEAGLCLYGNDIDLTTTPAEAALEWSIPKSRRQTGTVTRRRVGLRPESRPVRGGAFLFADESSTESIGHVTSGGFGPTINGPVSMGYVSTVFSHIGTKLFADIRGERYPVKIQDLPFVPHRYKR
jgi:aminomethyltransferase